jgi:hypothetical protein
LRISASKATRLIIIAVITALGRRTWRWYGLDLDIIDGENTFLAGSQILAQPPICVHVFVNSNLVANLEIAVAGFEVSVEGSSTCKLEFLRSLTGWRGWRGGTAVCGRSGIFVEI